MTFLALLNRLLYRGLRPLKPVGCHLNTCATLEGNNYMYAYTRTTGHQREGASKLRGEPHIPVDTLHCPPLTLSPWIRSQPPKDGSDCSTRVARVKYIATQSSIQQRPCLPRPYTPLHTQLIRPLDQRAHEAGLQRPIGQAGIWCMHAWQNRWTQDTQLPMLITVFQSRLTMQVCI